MPPFAKYRILLVEDHADLAETVLDFLTSMGWEVDYAADGMTGLHLSRTQNFDAIVLDVMLPGLDGLTLCRQLREQYRSSTPIIMMTARDELSDKLAGFENGADDYLVKPFDLPELVARVDSVVRRHQRRLMPETLQVADLVLDTGSRQVHRAGKELSLSPTSFKILSILLQNSPNVVSRETLEFELWNDSPPASDSLRSLIYKLRKTVDKPFDHSLISTVQGAGYKVGE